MASVNDKKDETTGIALIYKKTAYLASLAGTNIKEYLHDDKNIHHFSLVVYDLLPFTVKVGLRHDKFHERFASLFKKIRNQVFTYEDNTQKPTLPTQIVEGFVEPSKPLFATTKPVTKKTVAAKKTAAKKTVTTKKAVKKVAAKKAPAKKVAARTAKKVAS